MEPHEQRRVAESYGANAERYELRSRWRSSRTGRWVHPIAGAATAAKALPLGGRLAAAGGFGEPERWRFDWERHYTRDEWLDQLPTSGGLAGLTPEQQTEATAGVGAAIDALGGGFTMPYATVALTVVRTEGS